MVKWSEKWVREELVIVTIHTRFCPPPSSAPFFSCLVSDHNAIVPVSIHSSQLAMVMIGLGPLHHTSKRNNNNKKFFSSLKIQSMFNQSTSIFFTFFFSAGHVGGWWVFYSPALLIKQKQRYVLYDGRSSRHTHPCMLLLLLCSQMFYGGRQINFFFRAPSTAH